MHTTATKQTHKRTAHKRYCTTNECVVCRVWSVVCLCMGVLFIAREPLHVYAIMNMSMNNKTCKCCTIWRCCIGDFAVEKTLYDRKQCVVKWSWAKNRFPYVVESLQWYPSKDQRTYLTLPHWIRCISNPISFLEFFFITIVIKILLNILGIFS